MKIAVFHPENMACAWSMAGGITSTLRKMGHSVTDVVMPTMRQADQQLMDYFKAERPKLEEVAAMDLLIVSGPEHICPWIVAIYGQKEWESLTMPKAAWLHESCRREDFQFDVNNFKWIADEFFFAGQQDADFHDQAPFLLGRSHWMPLGVDTDIFKPGMKIDLGNIPLRHAHEIAFIGLQYPKRHTFLQALTRHKIPAIKLGRVMIEDLNGFDAEGTARRLAANYRSIKVFLNLPAMSNMLVSKVYEVMACGTFLLTSSLPEDGIKNMDLFKGGKHLVYYKASHIPYLAQLLRDWIDAKHDEDRKIIAETGCKEVHENHSLKKRMEDMLTVIAGKATEARPDQEATKTAKD